MSATLAKEPDPQASGLSLQSPTRQPETLGLKKSEGTRGIGPSVLGFHRKRAGLSVKMFLLWMDKTLHHLGNHDKPLFVGNCRGRIIFRFL